MIPEGPVFTISISNSWMADPLQGQASVCITGRTEVDTAVPWRNVFVHVLISLSSYFRSFPMDDLMP